jgi:hypothetical protein
MTNLFYITSLNVAKFIIILLTMIICDNMSIPTSRNNIAFADSSNFQEANPSNIELEANTKLYSKKMFIKKEKKPNAIRYQSVLYKKLKTKNGPEVLIKKGKIVQVEKSDEKHRNQNSPMNKPIEERGLLASLGIFISKISGKSPKYSGAHNDYAHVQTVPSNQGVICGLSVGNMPYVTLTNGKKIFEGGKLDNGCKVQSIYLNYIILDCNGRKIKNNL